MSTGQKDGWGTEDRVALSRMVEQMVDELERIDANLNHLVNQTITIIRILADISIKLEPRK